MFPLAVTITDYTENPDGGTPIRQPERLEQWSLEQVRKLYEPGMEAEKAMVAACWTYCSVLSAGHHRVYVARELPDPAGKVGEVPGTDYLFTIAVA